MQETPKNRDSWATILFTALLAAGFALLVLGVFLAMRDAQFIVLGLGVLAVIVPASVFAVAGRGGDSASGQNDAQLKLLHTISERMLISDQAKRIAYRQKDRDTLRQAILEDIRIEDYGAAMALVNDMAELYGYREEAEQYRQQIIEAQSKKRRADIRAAITKVDVIAQKHDWDQARLEIERLNRVYPDYPEIKQLSARVAEARDAYKRDLLREFKEASEKEDTERAAALLLEIDRYLTPDEARPYTEMARAVLNRKRENMGVRFKMAVQDRDWINALSVGEQIIREFPNSMFASEVREMLETLRERAAGQRTAGATGA